jgi:hypothetical protein
MAVLNLLGTFLMGVASGALFVEGVLVSLLWLIGAGVCLFLMLFNMHCRAVWKATGEWP